MIHTDGSVTIDQVRAVELPDYANDPDLSNFNPGRFWKPIKHADLLDTLFATAEEKGLEITGDRWEMRRNGHNLFGRLDFVTPKGMALPNGMGLSLGLRHSNISRYALTFVVGAHVFVCSNGMMVGEFAVQRRHTTHMNVRQVIDEGFDRFLTESKQIKDFVMKLKSHELNDNQACRYIIEAGRAHVMPWAELNKVQQLWYEPNHKDFKPRNKWSLYNAFTEVVRDRPTPMAQMKELKNVSRFILDPVEQLVN